MVNVTVNEKRKKLFHIYKRDYVGTAFNSPSLQKTFITSYKKYTRERDSTKNKGKHTNDRQK